MPARIYLSGLLENRKISYRGGVRRYIMLGTPNLGLDFSFRYPFLNFGADGVLSWDRILFRGEMLDTTLYSIYEGGAFPGQRQMLFSWDGIYPLELGQPDYWTTYHGGTGLYGRSQGICRAIEQGGNLIEKLEETGVAAGLELAILAGCKNDFPVPCSGVDGDGILFTKSVLHTSGLTRNRAKLLAKHVLPVNHLELLFSPLVWKWINYQLGQVN
ncbi:MAG TPA: hypothetical protein DCK87_06540 [Desulfotomaculum sp.]|nr:hypothetical protein [Desulfotomaculum sp.]